MSYALCSSSFFFLFPLGFRLSYLIFHCPFFFLNPLFTEDFMVTKFCLGMAPCGIWIHRTGFDFFVFFFSLSSLLFGIAPAYWGRISKFPFCKRVSPLHFLLLSPGSLSYCCLPYPRFEIKIVKRRSFIYTQDGLMDRYVVAVDILPR